MLSTTGVDVVATFPKFLTVAVKVVEEVSMRPVGVMEITPTL